MAFLTRFSLLKVREVSIAITASYTPRVMRKKERKRKPRYLPMAKSKVFRIPVHPYVPPEEKDLVLELLEEYTNKFESLRALYKKEVDEKYKDDSQSVAFQQQDAERFSMLLMENEEENERVRVVREEMLEKIFQEKKQMLLEQYEELKANEEKIRKIVDEKVKKIKEKHESYITLETLDEVIEKAVDNPVNINFAIDLNGGVKWEGKPPASLEDELRRNIEKSLLV